MWAVFLLDALGLKRTEISDTTAKQMAITGRGSQSRACGRHLVYVIGRVRALCDRVRKE